MCRRLAISLTAIALAIGVPQAFAGDLSTASRNLSAASGLVATGSLQMLVGSGQVVVGAIEVSGETTVLVLRGLAAGAEASILVSSEIVAGLGIAVGTMVSVIAETAGYALLAGVRLLAYLPNETTQALLHQSRLD
jgi:hypothetical protein